MKTYQVLLIKSRFNIIYHVIYLIFLSIFDPKAKYRHQHTSSVINNFT